MKKTFLKQNHEQSFTREKILQLCFDAKSIQNFKPGLKMVFALDDPPIFVNLEEVELDRNQLMRR